ncbi:amino acid ABC transporter permease [Azospirillum sp. TSH7]|uniref:amino acid ABC transporter permease n=1 Tax=unclassified Azospirillum TaxID=2630922 RepID=UPI000D60E051|nr:MULTISPECIES: amino acid ABC transporter permease [unclassified Azospirillum]PWC60762.1 amino acid ABC transporter permease [Azospirillum sp. TSH20]PWC67308.1 amino acid ABC transporter permease [Azospirillum sp. TSH7]
MTDGVLQSAPPLTSPQPRWQRLWAGLFGTPLNAAMTLCCLALLGWVVPPLLRWTLLDAVWVGPADRCADAAGACWAFIGEKLRYILFGFYDQDRQWRPAVAGAILLVLAGVSGMPLFWRRATLWLWLLGLAAALLLLTGGPGGPTVPTERWSGLPVSLLLAVVGLVGAFPLAVLLALARRSSMGGVRTLAVLFIEVTRGVPLIAVLYVATLLLPLMLPAGAAIDKLLRAQIAIVLFVSAYLAEIIRAGLQSIPAAQYEAAQALGLGYWQSMRLVILPQALRTVIPSIVTLAIGLFQDTTLIIVIGLFDLLNTARTAAKDPAWLGFYDEAFGFVALIYLTVCVIASRYSLWLERRLQR